MISDLYASLTEDKLSICINFGRKYCKKIIKGFKIQVHTDCFFRFGKMVIIKFGYLSSINKVLKTSNQRNPNGKKEPANSGNVRCTKDPAIMTWPQSYQILAIRGLEIYGP